MGQTYAYLRVSTREQNEERQLTAIEGLEIPKDNVFLDKESGKNFHRPEYIKMKAKMEKGDILYIKSIDRLGRNYHEILEEWRFLTREKYVDIVVLDIPLLDTRIGKDLTETLIFDLVLQILSYVAERWNRGELSLKEAAKESGLSLSTFYRRAKGGKGLIYEIGIINRKTVFFDHKIMALTKHSAFHYIKNSLAIIPIFSISKSDFLKRPR